MQILALSTNERLVLIAAAKSSNRSILSLRKDVGLGLDKFVTAIQYLEQKKLLTRDVGRFDVLPSAFKWIADSQFPPKKKSKEEYLTSVSVPQLSVTDFFIPDREMFLKDLKQSR